MNTALLWDTIAQRPPGKWPFPPPRAASRAGRAGGKAPAAGQSGDAPSAAGPSDAARPQGGPVPAAPVTRGRMVADVLMVLAWGALIPGLMWLGHAAGF